MKFRPVLALALLFSTSLGVAGDEQEIAVEAPAEDYEAGRGLLTLQGPTGMFINPTSATLPQGAFTAQYCAFFPFVDTSIVGHGWMASYGLTDWFEAGLQAGYIDNDIDPSGFGPLARARLTKDEGWMPQTSIGFYGKYGDTAIQSSNVFGALYKRLPLDEDGLFKALGGHAGLRGSWVDGGDALVGYFGAELQLPYRLYIVGELSTRDDIAGDTMPFSYGLQWRAGGINLSAAMLQPGGIPGGPGFYFGIGTQLSF